MLGIDFSSLLSCFHPLASDQFWSFLVRETEARKVSENDIFIAWMQKVINRLAITKYYEVEARVRTSCRQKWKVGSIARTVTDKIIFID